MKRLAPARGFNLSIEGRPQPDIVQLPEPPRLALLPDRIAFVKPRLLVKEGNTVRIGSALFEDKRDERIRCHSPGAGRVERIVFGPRRVIQAIVIALDAEEAAVEYAPIAEDQLDEIPRNDVVEAIVQGGLWPLLRELPFRDYPSPDSEPPMIFVSLGSTEPFQPEPSVYVAQDPSLLRYGLKVMQRLASGRVMVGMPASADGAFPDLADWITHTYSGPYPAHDPGVWLYQIRNSSEQNRSWFVDGQDLLLLAQLLRTGRYPTRRTVAVAGPAAPRRRHVRTRLGAPLAHLLPGAPANGTRLIAGGVLTGYAASPDSYLGLMDKALNLVPEGDRRGEFLGFVRPGYRKPTYSRTFVSRLHRKPLETDCNTHGGVRACIACGYCAEVCPVEILPQFTYKAVLAGEIEEALAHGLLDCVECALCSYVCPSKLELVETFKSAKAQLMREQGRR